MPESPPPKPPSSTKPTTYSTHFLPPHIGPHIFPNFSFLTQLLHNAHKDRLAIRDDNLRLEKTYAELLVDAVTLREVLRQSLPLDSQKRLDRQQRHIGGEREDESVFVGVLAPGGYEYVVAIVAVWALGAVPVPMTIALPVEEAIYFVRKSHQSAILTASTASTLGTSISHRLQSITTSPKSPPLPSINILHNIQTPLAPLSTLLISTTHHLPLTSPGIIIFTSGTTGPPKGAVIPRHYINDGSRAVANHYNLTPADTLLHLLPVHHVTGLAINILPFLLTGASIEFRSGSFDPKWTWNRFRDTNTTPLTIFSAVPTIYMRMMRYYQRVLAKLPAAELEPYVAGVRRFRALLCGTSALPRPVQQFWTEIRQGEPVMNRYGSTEGGVVLLTRLDDRTYPDGAAGQMLAGVDAKLAQDEGNGNEAEGEILVRSPYLFSRYLDDPAATSAAFDPQGYFKTGDIARREDHHYFIVGRASQDIIKSGGYKISALDIEREILALPYIGEIVIVGVADMEFGQRVGAIITLREDQDVFGTAGGAELTIHHLRDDLRTKLANYKLPTLLRVWDGELPKTASGKVLKKQLGPEAFPVPGWEKDSRVQAWRSRMGKL